MTEPLLLTEEQAAARLLMHPRTLRKLRQEGKIRYVALTNRKIAYKPEDCAAFVEQHVRQEPQHLPRPRSGRPRINSRRGGNIVPFTARQGTGR
jgi:hypothetical protein